MLLLSFLQKQQTSLKPFKPFSDQLEISPCDVNALQNKVVMRIERMITEDESKWYFNKFSPPLLLEMYGNNKTEFWYFGHHQGKQAPIYHKSFLFLWTERCRPLPAPPLFDSLWHGKTTVQNLCSRISLQGLTAMTRVWAEHCRLSPPPSFGGDWIVLSCFYLLIFYFQKFSTQVWRLPYTWSLISLLL